MATTRPVLLRVRNVCDNSCREIQNMYFILSDLLSENRVIYEKNVEKYGRSRQATYGNMSRRMRIA